MTSEEAIELLNQYNLYSPTKQIEEAIDIAIEALEADAEQGVGRYENAMQKLRDMPRYLNGVKEKQITKVSTNYTTESPNDVVERKNDVVAEPTDLISRADVKAEATKFFGHWVVFENRINNLPSILSADRPTIVRCKDCIRRNSDYDCPFACGDCANRDNDFCSWGKRKGEDEE